VSAGQGGARSTVPGQGTWEAQTDLVVVGSGVAGLTAALCAQQRGLRVLVVSKGTVDDSSTAWAQGGIAVVGVEALAAGDSVQAHVTDTLTAGVGLCDEAAVRSIITAGAGAVKRLVARGARFDRSPDGSTARTREGGHTFRRVVHAGGDATGAEVERALVAAARTEQLVVLEHHTATQVLLGRDGTVNGVAVADESGGVGVLHAPAVLLATGGLGHLYAATTNPGVATGDGVALALAAGARVSDLEFVQFHPTVLFAPGATGQRPLVTEAVRGEGAVLVDLDGTSVMSGVHPMADLAPRDVVAAAITERMRRSGTDHVLLDARAIAGFAHRFPTVQAACVAVGLDPTVQPIPVAPAAHYSCGGVVTDVNGCTSVTGLYAAGEVARTGLHGANRLASNSLLEGLVIGERVAVAAAERVAEAGPVDATLPPAPTGRVLSRERLQQLMSVHGAIGRDAEGLDALDAELDRASGPGATGRRGWEDANLTTVAAALVLGAAARRESRGCHVRSDYSGQPSSPTDSTTIELDRETGRPALREKMGTAA
jgi:L-aspartate oxidase